MSAAKLLAESFTPLVDLIYPPRCPLCGEGLAAQKGLCTACWSELAIPGEPACNACQRPFGEEGPGHGLTCAACLHNPPKHDGIAAGTLYNDTARKLVLRFKHGRKIALAPMLARLMAARLPALEGEWYAVPVPLHRFRLWRRTYNQSALLAGELAKITGATLLVDALKRTRPTPPLGGLGRMQRAKALQGAIAVDSALKDRLKGAQVLLVDDVLTSGATSNACVSVLRRAGAAKIVIACFSRVLDEAL